jgi:hypothetical protein
MEDLLRTLAGLADADDLLLRGGMVTRRWYPSGRRVPDDLDFLARFPYDPERILSVLSKLAPVLEWQPIWEETASPGLRAMLQTPAGPLQVDVATGDPVDPPAERVDGLLCPRRELMMAWKLHGLFEREDGYWRPKDLADLWAMADHAPVDAEALEVAIQSAFASRDAPIRVADRLVDGSFGSSSSSSRTWRRYRRERPWLPELAQAVEVLRLAVVPVLLKLRGPRLARFPVIESAQEVTKIARDAGFGVYEREDCTVLTYELQSAETFPLPRHAPTFAEHRRRKLLREFRGLTFDREGALAARKLHKFFNLPEQETVAPRTEVLEKLDGSMVTALVLNGELRFHTRRGPSDIADAAAVHGDAEFCHNWLESGYTPIFEWCAVDHRIVLAHPHDRLVVVAIRERRTGEYVRHDIVEESAHMHGVEPIRRLGFWEDADWRSDVARWEGREGVVLRTPEDRFWKLKSPWYRTAHHALMDEDPLRFRWILALEGRGDFLNDLGIGTDPILARGRLGLAIRVSLALGKVEDKKSLALALEGHPRLFRSMAFRAWDDEPISSAVDAVLLATLRMRGRWRDAVQLVRAQ